MYEYNSGGITMNKYKKHLDNLVIIANITRYKNTTTETMYSDDIDNANDALNQLLGKIEDLEMLYDELRYGVNLDAASGTDAQIRKILEDINEA